MSTCRSLQHIFENPLPENPTLLESLSWNKIKPLKPIDHSSSSFTEIFGELHFKESPEPSPSPSSLCSCPSLADIEHAKVSDTNQTPFSAYVPSTPITNHANIVSHKKSGDSFTSLNSESLHLCTEGLGSESSDDVEDLKGGINEWWQTQKEKEGGGVNNNNNYSYGECRTRSRVKGGKYPPPISCIGRSGKPWVSFRSYRNNGRFVLRGIRIPTQELLHAHREDGRLLLHFVEPDEEFLEEEEEYDDVELESVVEEGEEIMGKENENCVIEFNEEKRD